MYLNRLQIKWDHKPKKKKTLAIGFWLMALWLVYRSLRSNGFLLVTCLEQILVYHNAFRQALASRIILCFRIIHDYLLISSYKCGSNEVLCSLWGSCSGAHFSMSANLVTVTFSQYKTHWKLQRRQIFYGAPERYCVTEHSFRWIAYHKNIHCSPCSRHCQMSAYFHAVWLL
jgi:hypothetical protein